MSKKGTIEPLPTRGECQLTFLGPRGDQTHEDKEEEGEGEGFHDEGNGAVNTAKAPRQRNERLVREGRIGKDGGEFLAICEKSGRDSQLHGDPPLLSNVVQLIFFELFTR